MERRQRVTHGGITLVNWQQEEPTDFNGRRQPSRSGTSRISREAYVRFCERLGVKLPGPTRRSGNGTLLPRQISTLPAVAERRPVMPQTVLLRSELSPAL